MPEILENFLSNSIILQTVFVKVVDLKQTLKQSTVFISVGIML